MEAELLKVYYFVYREKFPATLVLSMMDSLMNEGVKRNKTWLVVRTEYLIAHYNIFTISQYELGFEHFQKMYTLLKKFTSDEFPYKQFFLYQMAQAYYNFADFRQAITYFHEMLLQTSSVDKEYSFRITISSLNTIGLCYQELRMLDSSDYYFTEAYQKAVSINNSPYQGITSGNLGYNCFLRKQYDKAIPLLQKDIDLAVAYKDWGLASGSLMPLAAIHLERNNIAKADELLQQARRYVYMSGQYRRLKTLYPLLTKLYAAKGNAALASVFLDSSLYVKDSLARQFNAMQILRAQQKIEREQQKAEVANINNQKKIEILKRNILIAIVVLTMLLSVYIYRQLQKKQRLNKEKLQKAEDELRLAANQLDDFTKYILEKNTLIETLQVQLGNDEGKALQQLHHSTILTNVEWEYFRQLFEKVHSGYLQRLKEKIPGLTPAETRFMALSKLKFSNKEMAATLGVSPQAIRVISHRLRKKLDLPEESSIDDLVDSL